MPLLILITFLGVFFAGNEVINSEEYYGYRHLREKRVRNYRQIPVGYSAADIASNRLLVTEYFNCGNDSEMQKSICLVSMIILGVVTPLTLFPVMLQKLLYPNLFK